MTIQNLTAIVYDDVGLALCYTASVDNFLNRPILKGDINFPVCLAPMVGLSHVALRLMVRRYLPKGAKTIWPTEMLNSRKVPKQILGETPETRRAEQEDFLVPQILGNERQEIADSIAALKGWGAKGIDINMGCPVRKALRHNYGVALMGDPDYAKGVVEMAATSSALPVSVKMRAGFQSDEDFLLNFVRGLEEAGAAWICLHPRLASQGRRGNSDWSQIRKVRENSSLPVIGNGDIQVVDDIFAMNSETNCDMVMVGRALTARPWLLWQAGERLGFSPPEGFEGRRAPQTSLEEGEEFGRALGIFINALEAHFNPSEALKRLNFYMRNAHPWLEFGHALAAELTKAQSLSEARGVVTRFFAQEQHMQMRTDLRY